MKKDPPAKRPVTPLLRFIRALETPSRGEDGGRDRFKKEFSDDCGARNLTYLYQLARSENPNPTLQLAYGIVNASKAWAPRTGGLPPLTYEDLLIGCDRRAERGDAPNEFIAPGSD